MAMEPAIVCGSASPSQSLSFRTSVAYFRFPQLGRLSASRSDPTQRQQRLVISISAVKRSPKRLKYSSPPRFSKVFISFSLFHLEKENEENPITLLQAVCAKRTFIHLKQIFRPLFGLRCTASFWIPRYSFSGRRGVVLDFRVFEGSIFHVWF